MMMQMNGCLARMEMNTRHREALALASQIRQAQLADNSNSGKATEASRMARTGGLAALMGRLFVPAGTSRSSTRV